MTVFSPNEYSIEIEKEEIEILNKAYDVFNTIHKQMNKKDCDTLEGGYVECPFTFEKTEIIEIKHFLENFIENIPTKMY